MALSNRLIRAMQITNFPFKPVGGGPAFIQSVMNPSAVVANPTATATINGVRAGSRLIVFTSSDGAQANNNITDNNGTVYTRHVFFAPGNSIQCWSGIAPVAGTYNITGVANTSGFRTCMTVVEAGAGIGFDTSASSAVGAASQSAGVNPSSIALVLGACIVGTSTPAVITVNAPFGLDRQAQNANTNTYGLAHELNALAGVLTTCTFNQTGGNMNCMIVVSFK